MSVHIRTLGQDQILIGGEAVHWPSRAARNLFFMLLVEPRGLTRSEITERLWGDSPATESNSNFKVTQFRVRQALGNQRATREEGGRYVLAPEYHQNADHVQFQEALEEARAAHGRDERLRHLSRALELYRGDFLPDQLTDWTEETRDTLRAAAVRARLEVAQTHCSGVECHSAVRSLAGALASDPLAGERYHQDLMTCLCTLHRSDEAVSHYRHFLTFIQREIGDTPTQDTVLLAEQIRAGEPHLSRHIGAQTPCPRRTLYGDAYIGRAPQPGLDALLLAQALERGQNMLGLLRRTSALHTWPELDAVLDTQLPALLGTPHTGLSRGQLDEAQGTQARPRPAGIAGAVQAALEQVRPGPARSERGRPAPGRPVPGHAGDGFRPAGAGSGETGTYGAGVHGAGSGPAEATDARVLVEAIRTTDPPQLWLWAAWAADRPVPGAARDLLRGAADVLESVLAQPHWASPETGLR